jgi:hypothetical protein
MIAETIIRSADGRRPKLQGPVPIFLRPVTENSTVLLQLRPKHASADLQAFEGSQTVRQKNICQLFTLTKEAQ